MYDDDCLSILQVLHSPGSVTLMSLIVITVWLCVVDSLIYWYMFSQKKKEKKNHVNQV